MCYNVQNRASTKALVERFNANFQLPSLYTPKDQINAFEKTQLPIITNENNKEFLFANWGLLPQWVKDESFSKNTKNARWETLGDKPSFQGVQHQRCLIPATGFYEWKWHDSKGKTKEKFFIQSKSTDIFSLAGLYNRWINPVTGKESLTFTVITKSAEGIMKEIHNTKQRMPIILKPEKEKSWLFEDTLDYLIDFKADSQTPMNLTFPF
jgi:putative SOS response-associated peptidase YedK